MFGSFGFIEGLLLVAIAMFFARRGALAAAGPVLVLRKFEVSESGPVAVRIEGRPSGLVAWLLTTIGMDTLTTLTVTQRQVSFTAASLSGEMHQVIPVSRVSSTHCGYSQPVWMLVLAALIVVLSLLSAMGRSGSAETVLVGLIFALVLAAVFWFQKKIAITIETSGGMLLGLSFKPSAVEMVSVTLQQAIAATERINALVLADGPESPPEP